MMHFRHFKNGRIFDVTTLPAVHSLLGTAHAHKVLRTRHTRVHLSVCAAHWNARCVAGWLLAATT